MGHLWRHSVARMEQTDMTPWKLHDPVHHAERSLRDAMDLKILQASKGLRIFGLDVYHGDIILLDAGARAGLVQRGLASEERVWIEFLDMQLLSSHSFGAVYRRTTQRCLWEVDLSESIAMPTWQSNDGTSTICLF